MGTKWKLKLEVKRGIVVRLYNMTRDKLIMGYFDNLNNKSLKK
jgi:hypothetical protein